MTWIISSNCKTKKQLTETVKRINAGEHIGTISMENPSMFETREKAWYYLEQIPEGFNEVVTNHPKRSWFARIEKRNGKLRVA